MRRALLHTPEGVRDIYGEECEKKLLLQERLFEALLRYGYRPIQTPTFEFFDTFSREVGTTPSRDLYKFFDKEGNTLVLRPDITPSIARSAAMYFGEEDMPVRLCYMGSTFQNSSRYQGRLKESTQLGAELIGEPSADADAELVAMVADCLLEAGLSDFQISIGHADFFKGLSEAAGLDDEQEEALRSLISNKNFFGVEEFVGTLGLDGRLGALFGMLGKVYNGAGELGEAARLAEGYPRIHSAICRLCELSELLAAYGADRYVAFEPGTVSGYRYYTGIVFAGFTYGSGEPVVRGGRYDSLLPHFGKDAASIGFAIVTDQLMAALMRQGIPIEVPRETLLIVYEPTREKRLEAVALAKKHRDAGRCVELVRRVPGKTNADYAAYAERCHARELRFL